MGAKGIGEVGIVGTAAAIANAVHHATGIRIRDLPIRLDKLSPDRGRQGTPLTRITLRPAMSTTHGEAIPRDAPHLVDALPAKPPGHNRQRPDLPGERRAGVRRRLFVAADIDDSRARRVCERRRAVARRRLDRPLGRAGELSRHDRVPGRRGRRAVDEVARGAAAARAPQLRLPSTSRSTRSAVFRTRGARGSRGSGRPRRCAAFGALCRRVRDALAVLGLHVRSARDRAVTLARAVGLPAELPHIEPPSTPPLRITGLTLYESVTAPSGARYDLLEWLPLGDAARGERSPAETRQGR